MRRLAAAALSALIPGLGQLLNGRRRLAALFLIPSLILLALGALIVGSQSGPRLAAWIISPQVLGTLLALNVLVLAWRLVAVGQAFLDTGRTGPTGRLGIVGLVVIAILVVLPHLAVYRYGSILGDTFDRIFTGEVLGASTIRGANAGPVPGEGERVNVLIVGSDKRGKRTANLTDTMMVASLDPVGHSVSIVSIPRDLIGTPLGNGDVFGPKLNSLMHFADSHPKAYPQGGLRTLEDAVGALLGIPIHYYASLDFDGFIKMVDAVGGVDVNVTKGFADPTYDGFGFEGKGYAIAAGPHHLDGANALAYARTRKAVGESDFTRQARQQQILLALRSQATRGGSLLFKLPGPARRRRRYDPLGRARRPAAGPGRDHGGGRSGRRDQRRHPLAAGPPEEDLVRRFAGARPDRDPGDGGQALLRAGHGACPVAEPEADQGPQGDRRPEGHPDAVASRPAAARAQNPSAMSLGVIRRAARARCEMACFSEGVHRPSVRPPGGSEAGSKMGS